MLKMWNWIVREYRRYWHTREVRFWAERIELVEQRRLSFQVDMQYALDQCAFHKRELVLLDLMPVRVSRAPGKSPSDGIKRFSLVDDKPKDPHTPIARRRELKRATGKKTAA